MKKVFFIIGISLLFFLGTTTSFTVHGQTAAKSADVTPPQYVPLSGITTPTGENLFENATVGDPSRILQRMYQFGIGITLTLAFLYTLYAGYEYITTDIITKKGDARKRLENVVWGVGIALCSFTFLYTVNPDLLSFRFTQPKLTITEGQNNFFELLWENTPKLALEGCAKHIGNATELAKCAAAAAIDSAAAGITQATVAAVNAGKQVLNGTTISDSGITLAVAQWLSGNANINRAQFRTTVINGTMKQNLAQDPNITDKFTVDRISEIFIKTADNKIQFAQPGVFAGFNVDGTSATINLDSIFSINPGESISGAVDPNRLTPLRINDTEQQMTEKIKTVIGERGRLGVMANVTLGEHTFRVPIVINNILTQAPENAEANVRQLAKIRANGIQLLNSDELARQLQITGQKELEKYLRAQVTTERQAQ